MRLNCLESVSDTCIYRFMVFS